MDKAKKSFRGEELFFAYDVDPQLGSEEWDIVAEWCIKNTDPSDAFIDIGANIGYISALVAKFANPRLIVVVEPDITLHKFIVENLKAYASKQTEVILCEKMVMDQSAKKVLFFRNADNPAQSSIYARPEFENVDVLGIEATSVDELMAEHKITGSIVLKVDAEFAEPLIWKGMQKTLPQIKAMVMEYNKMKLPEVANDVNIQEFIADLSNKMDIRDLNANNVACYKK